MDTKPKHVPADSNDKLWHKRARCSRLYLIGPLAGIAIHLLDVVLDCLVAYGHYQAGDCHWFAVTTMIIVVSSFVVQGVSAYRLIDDRKHRENQVECMESLLGIKTDNSTYVLHALQLGLVVRFWRIFQTVRKVRTLDDVNEDEESKTQIKRLLIDQRLDSSLLGVMASFLEDAPQLLLQLYIIILQKRWSMSLSEVVVAINVLKSLVFFSRSVASYTTYTHLADENTMPLPACAQVGLYVRNFFTLVARVLAVVLFASVFKVWWMLLLCGIHFIISFIILMPQPCEYFRTSKVKVVLFKFVFTYIHLFVFFPLADADTRRYAFPYYSFTLTENAIMTTLWWLWTDYGMVFRIAVVSIEGAAFIIGILAMATYYRWATCCHPRRPQSAESPNAVDGTILYETAI